MGPRRKSDLSPTSRNAKRLRLIRAKKAEEHREARLDAKRAQDFKTRVSETPTQRESRLAKQRAFMAAYRSKESKAKREARLSAQCDRRKLVRKLLCESETFKERQARLILQRTRAAISRSKESIEKREARLLADRERHALSRSKLMRTAISIRPLRAQDFRTRVLETPTQRESRLAKQRAFTAAYRSKESKAKREARLLADRERHALSRSKLKRTAISIRPLPIEKPPEISTESKARDTNI